MVDSNNDHFNKVYDKLISVVNSELKNLIKFRNIGRTIDYTNIKILNLYIRYLDYIKYSKYKYFTVVGLTDISNYLNRL